VSNNHIFRHLCPNSHIQTAAPFDIFLYDSSKCPTTRTFCRILNICTVFLPYAAAYDVPNSICDCTILRKLRTNTDMNFGSFPHIFCFLKMSKISYEIYKYIAVGKKSLKIFKIARFLKIQKGAVQLQFA